MKQLPDLSPLVGSEVTQVAFDYQVTFLLAGFDELGRPRVEATLTIGTDFTIAKGGSDTMVTPASAGNYRVVLGLLRKTIRGADVAPDETLTLHFQDDLAVAVHPHVSYESWELQGRGIDSWLVGPLA
ncbi:MAG: hypothetical protein IMZ75_03630 [Actinobacteria bacterium]|nr:hypothetical protein [Actinomycetota bacterium]